MTRYKDSRLFLVACDDRYAPAQYFEFFRIARVKIVVDATHDSKSAPQHVLSRLLARRDKEKLDPDDECWLVVDVDHNLQQNHRATFNQTIQTAKAEGIRIALSCPCFEFWLLLHHISETEAANLGACDQILAAIKVKTGSYNKTNLREQDYSDGSAVEAILRAERLDNSIPGGDIPYSATTRVYKLLKAVMEKSLPSELPAVLRS